MLKNYVGDLFVGLLIACVALQVPGFELESSSAGDERVCKPPRPPRNGSVTVWGHGMLVEYTCDHGLFPIGETFGSCNPISGRWSVRTPYCASSACKKPGSLLHGTIYFSHNSSVMTAQCEPGYKLVGSRRRYCDGAGWSGRSASCRARYPAGNDKREASEDVNTTDPDVIFRRQLALDISDADDTCYRSFSPPPEIENGQPIVEYEYNKPKRVWVAIANYTCNEGYKLADKYQRYKYCKRYSWVGSQTPSCVQDERVAEPCKDDNGGCQHVCVPYNDGRYFCDCRDGYTRATNPRKCIDVDECSLSNGGCEQTCNNLIGSYFCTCDVGYVASGPSCHDVNECEDPRRNSCPGTCINTPGSYSCNCTIPGFIPSLDKQICKDQNECEVNNGGCEDTCINLYGSYKCRCFKKGYRLSSDGKSCADVNECVKYSRGRCKHGDCINTPGSYQCDCQRGFYTSKNKRKCLDVDECRSDNGGCDQTCINTPGNYSCSCTDGYHLDHDGLSCTDIDECQTENGGCEGVCINTVGSYTCACPDNMMVLSQDKHDCTHCDSDHYYDISKGICIACREFSAVPPHINGTSPRDCVCSQGFRYNDVTDTCEDKDECSDNTILCDQICHNTIGSAYCSCYDGYTRLDGQCIDLDECQTNVSRCTQHCNNTEGSYICYCDEGYELGYDNVTCEDIDECYRGQVICDQTCVNIPGGAICECLVGFQLEPDGITCTDKDECVTGNHVCSDVCINTNGSYRCECAGSGFKLSWDKASCSDMNECMEGVNTCQDVCINTQGSYRCSCSKPGYRLNEDNSTCEDVDECNERSGHICDHLCINEPGSYRCDCHPGYSLASFHTCAPCPRGYYRTADSPECTPCPAMSVTMETASTSIADCQCINGYHGNLTAGEVCHKN